MWNTLLCFSTRRVSACGFESFEQFFSIVILGRLELRLLRHVGLRGQSADHVTAKPSSCSPREGLLHPVDVVVIDRLDARRLLAPAPGILPVRGQRTGRPRGGTACAPVGACGGAADAALGRAGPRARRHQRKAYIFLRKI